MIPRINGETTTPRQMAKEIIKRELDSSYYWTEHYYEAEARDMTQREKELVSEQIDKIVKRVKKYIG